MYTEAFCNNDILRYTYHFAGYDGGDCCACDCTANQNTIFVCGTESSGYKCIDPNSACVDDDDYVPDFAGATNSLARPCSAAKVGAAATVAGLLLVAMLGMLL